MATADRARQEGRLRNRVFLCCCFSSCPCSVLARKLLALLFVVFLRKMSCHVYEEDDKMHAMR